MPNRPAFIVAFVLLFVVTAWMPVRAQVVARQGESKQKEEAKPIITQFETPMVLEFPLDDVLGLPVGGQHYFKGLNLYECEGVTLGQFIVTKKSESAKNGLSFAIEGVAATSERVQTAVTLNIEVVGDGRVLVKDQVPNLLLRENSRTRPFKTRMEIASENVATAQMASEKLLRLTVHVLVEGAKETDEAGVVGCELLGTITGHSGFGGLAAPLGAQGAMKSAKKKAARMGATHIVFLEVDGSGTYTGGLLGSGGRSTARAYRCPG